MRALRSFEMRDFPQVTWGKKHKARLNPGHALQHPPGPLRQTPATWMAPPNMWAGPALVVWQRGPSAADFTLHQGLFFFDDKFIHHLFFLLLNSHAKSFHSCLTLCNPIDCSPPGFSVHGSLQARILEWVVMPFSRESSLPGDQTWVSYVSCIGRQVLYH